MPKKVNFVLISEKFPTTKKPPKNHQKIPKFQKKIQKIHFYHFQHFTKYFWHYFKYFLIFLLKKLSCAPFSFLFSNSLLPPKIVNSRPFSPFHIFLLPLPSHMKRPFLFPQSFKSNGPFTLYFSSVPQFPSKNLQKCRQSSNLQKKFFLPNPLNVRMAPSLLKKIFISNKLTIYKILTLHRSL